MRFEVKMARCREETIRKECWKRWAEDRGFESEMGKERKDFLHERGWTKAEWKNAIERLEEAKRELDKENQKYEMKERRTNLGE